MSGDEGEGLKGKAEIECQNATKNLGQKFISLDTIRKTGTLIIKSVHKLQILGTLLMVPIRGGQVIFLILSLKQRTESFFLLSLNQNGSRIGYRGGALRFRLILISS